MNHAKTCRVNVDHVCNSCKKLITDCDEWHAFGRHEHCKTNPDDLAIFERREND